MQRARPTKLSNYPWVVVRFDCVFCTRRGRYSLARLAAQYGPEQDLDGLLHELAHDCPWWNERARKYEPRCGARLVDLVHNLPPRDLPPAVIAAERRRAAKGLMWDREPWPADAEPESVHRQRAPDRESLPKRQPSGRDDEYGRWPMLSDLPAGWPVVVTCSRCDRREVRDRDVLLAEGDVSLVELRVSLVADCPRRRAMPETDRCSTWIEHWPP